MQLFINFLVSGFYQFAGFIALSPCPSWKISADAHACTNVCSSLVQCRFVTPFLYLDCFVTFYMRYLFFRLWIVCYKVARPVFEPQEKRRLVLHLWCCQAVTGMHSFSIASKRVTLGAQ